MTPVKSPEPREGLEGGRGARRGRQEERAIKLNGGKDEKRRTRATVWLSPPRVLNHRLGKKRGGKPTVRLLENQVEKKKHKRFRLLEEKQKKKACRSQAELRDRRGVCEWDGRWAL